MARASYGIVRIVSVAVVVVGLTVGNAFAGESSVGAYVAGRVAYTDNLALHAEGDEQGATVSEVSTGINFDRLQPHIDAHVVYDVQGLFYQDAALDQVFHQLDARANLRMAERLFLDVFGVYDQTIADPTAQYFFNNLAVTNNRTDAAVLGLSPAVALDMGENITGELRYTVSWSDYESPDLQDSSERITEFYLGNGELRRGFSWELAYDHEQFEYDLFPDVQYETFAAQLGYWVGPRVRLFTTQGLESDYRLVLVTTGESAGLDDHYWEVGIELIPNERANLQLTFGERSWGETLGVQGSVETRHGAFSLSYTEQPSSFVRDNIGTARTTGELAPIDTLAGQAGNLFYLQKHWDAAYILERAKSQLGFRVYDDRRFDIVAAVDDVEHETERYRGAEIWFNWSLNVVWDATLSLLVVERATAATLLEEEFAYVTIDFGRQIGQKSYLSFMVAHETGNPVSGPSVNRYQENQISVAFQRSYGTQSAGSVPTRYSRLAGAGSR